MAVRVSPASELNCVTSVAQFNSDAGSMIAPQVIQDVQNALGVIDYGADNFSTKNVTCPFHDDKHPSASLHNEKGLYCHACARWYKWKDLAEQLGFPWKASRRAQVEAVGWGNYIDGLPSETRNGLIAAGLTDLARALDLFYHYNYVTGDRIEYVTLDLLTSCI